MSEPSQPRVVRRFSEVISLIDRGRFEQSLNEAMREAVEAIRAQPGEKGKATITMEIGIAAQGEMMQVSPKLKVKLPEGDKAQFGDHRIHYPFPVTDEFKAWAAQDGKPMTQGEFAAFIEDRVAELAQATADEERELSRLFGKAKVATPADMLTLSNGLEVNVAGKVKNSQRLSSGEGELVFVEEHLDSTGAKIVVPNLFVICLPVFLDGEPVRLPARLRYRVGGGSVSWFYQLYRWKELVRERVLGDLSKVQEDTALPVYEGAPER